MSEEERERVYFRLALLFALAAAPSLAAAFRWVASAQPLLAARL